VYGRSCVFTNVHSNATGATSWQPLGKRATCIMRLSCFSWRAACLLPSQQKVLYLQHDYTHAGSRPRRGQMVPLRFPEQCPAEVAALQLACVLENPDVRPTAAQILELLMHLPAGSRPPEEAAPLLRPTTAAEALALGQPPPPPPPSPARSLRQQLPDAHAEAADTPSSRLAAVLARQLSGHRQLVQDAEAAATAGAQAAPGASPGGLQAMPPHTSGMLAVTVMRMPSTGMGSLSPFAAEALASSDSGNGSSPPAQAYAIPGAEGNAGAAGASTSPAGICTRLSPQSPDPAVHHMRTSEGQGQGQGGWGGSPPSPSTVVAASTTLSGRVRSPG